MPNESQFRKYIGDGVYADFDGYNVVLTTEDGIKATNRIVLEPDVWNDLMTYYQWMLEKLYKDKINDDISGNSTD